MIMLLATALIVLLFVISFKKLKDLTNKNDNRIVDCQKKIDEIVNKLQKVEQLDFAKELCDKERRTNKMLKL